MNRAEPLTETIRKGSPHLPTNRAKEASKATEESSEHGSKWIALVESTQINRHNLLTKGRFLTQNKSMPVK